MNRGNSVKKYRAFLKTCDILETVNDGNFRYELRTDGRDFYAIVTFYKDKIEESISTNCESKSDILNRWRVYYREEA